MIHIQEIHTYDIIASPAFGCATLSVNVISERELISKLNDEKMLNRNEKIDILLSDL